jgi:uncharacterized protein YbjT (DUF2867 family)
MNSHIGPRKFLVTGASGYVGGRLVRALIDDKEDVRILVRDKNKIMGQPWAPQVEICEGSAENFSDLAKSIRGCPHSFLLTALN